MARAGKARKPAGKRARPGKMKQRAGTEAAASRAAKPATGGGAEGVAWAGHVARLPGVTTGKMFGSDSLRVAGKVFAMVVKDHLVVKLPRTRVEALLASGEGTPFDPGHGRIMKEWVRIGPAQRLRWPDWSAEAHAFAGTS